MSQESRLFTPEEVALLLNQADLLKRARIFEGTTQKPFSIQKVVVDCSSDRTEANALPINFPFKSVYVESADQGPSIVYLKPQTKDSYQSAIALQRGDSISFDEPVAGCFLHWNTLSLGTDQTVTLIFFTDAKFESGRSSVRLESPGLLSVVNITLSAATAEELTSSWFDFPTGGNPRKWTIYNDTGATLYISDNPGLSDSGALKGFTIPAGGYFEHSNLSALYGYSVAGGNVQVMRQA